MASPHNVFRPPPSAALAVFDRPPSPSFYEALQAAGQPAKVSPNLQPNQAMPNPFTSPNGSTGPKIKLSLSSLKAATAPNAPAPVDGESLIPNRHPRTSMSVPQHPNSLVSTDTSPYAIGRIQKGKGKAKLSAAIAPETVVGVACPFKATRLTQLFGTWQSAKQRLLRGMSRHWQFPLL